jgi:hypothetical protein
MTFGGARLDCCRPTGAWGTGVSVVHGPLCHKAGRSLTDDEFKEWLARGLHPAGSNLPVHEEGYRGIGYRGRPSHERDWVQRIDQETGRSTS